MDRNTKPSSFGSEHFRSYRFDEEIVRSEQTIPDPSFYSQLEVWQMNPDGSVEPFVSEPTLDATILAAENQRLIDNGMQ